MRNKLQQNRPDETPFRAKKSIFASTIQFPTMKDDPYSCGLIKH